MPSQCPLRRAPRLLVASVTVRAARAGCRDGYGQIDTLISAKGAYRHVFADSGREAKPLRRRGYRVGKAAVEVQRGLRRVTMVDIAGYFQRLRGGIHRVGRRAVRDREPAARHSVVAVRADPGRAGGGTPMSAHRALQEAAACQTAGRWRSWPSDR